MGGERQQPEPLALSQSKFEYLANFELLAGRNVNQVYLEMEKDAF